MTRKELKDETSLAVFDALDKIGIHLDDGEYDAVADAALAVVREALREPDARMVAAARKGYSAGWYDGEALLQCIKHALAASPLAEGNDDA